MRHPLQLHLMGLPRALRVQHSPQRTPPRRAQLRSSAAQVARAFNRVYGLRLSTRGEMQAAFEGERLTPSLCGKMDQVRACSLAWDMHALAAPGDSTPLV